MDIFSQQRKRQLYILLDMVDVVVVQESQVRGTSSPAVKGRDAPAGHCLRRIPGVLRHLFCSYVLLLCNYMIGRSLDIFPMRMNRFRGLRRRCPVLLDVRQLDLNLS